MKRTNLRIGCLLLVLVLLLGVLPVTALADEVEELSPVAEMEKLFVYASYDGEVDETPFYYKEVEEGTLLLDYLRNHVPPLEKDGYTFDAWYKYDGPDYKFSETDTVSGWTNVLVKYTSVSQPAITATFVTANGTDPVVQEVTGGRVQKPTDPTMEGYKFLGWYTEDGTLFDFSSAVSSSLTLYAMWEKIEETPVVHYYLDDNFRTEHLDLVASVANEDYYVRMAVAWYFSTALVKQFDAALPVIENRRLDRWTHNKSIQKAVESFRIGDERKALLRSLKM